MRNRTIAPIRARRSGEFQRLIGVGLGLSQEFDGETALADSVSALDRALGTKDAIDLGVREDHLVPAAKKGNDMAESRIVLSQEEREYLLRLLETAMGETRVEAHRTHQPDFRTKVLAEEELLRGLISKLEKSA